jgi:hypothetical protein
MSAAVFSGFRCQRQNALTVPDQRPSDIDFDFRSSSLTFNG